MLYLASTEYADDCTYQINGKTYRGVLLRQSFSDSNGRTQHRNIANISSCSEEEIHVIKFALKHKNNLDFIRQLTGAKTQNWKIVGPSLYQSLASVEWASRAEKSQLGKRLIYLRKGHRTRGHLMVCMLAYKIEKHLHQCWKGLDIMVEEGMEKLSSIVGMKTQLGATKEILWIPEPDELNRQLLDRANVILPTYLPTKGTVVSTNEKLTEHRK